MKPNKCTLYQTDLPFFGRMAGRKEVSIDPEKIKAVKNRSVQTIQQLQSSLGLKITTEIILRILQMLLNSCNSLLKYV